MKGTHWISWMFGSVLMLMLGYDLQAQDLCIQFMLEEEALPSVYAYTYDASKPRIKSQAKIADEKGQLCLPCLSDRVGLVVESQFFKVKDSLNIFDCKTDTSLVVTLEYKSYSIGGVEVTDELINVIQKKDTTVYNTAAFQRATDVTLESMLKRLPDIEIRENSQVYFKGKLIDKILIDGEEVALGGHGLTTTTLPPELVKQIEVREKEKAKKYKANILNSSHLLVLDLKLDEKVNKSHFGKVTAGVGTQNVTYYPEANANLYAIRPKCKSLLLAATNGTGSEKVVSSNDLYRLDPAYLEKVLTLPADFDDLRTRETADKDLFLIDNRSKNIKSIIGGSNRSQITPHLDLSVATYLLRDKIERQSATVFETYDAPAISNHLNRQREHVDVTTKNALFLTYNPDDSLRIIFNNYFSYYDIKPNERLTNEEARYWHSDDHIKNSRFKTKLDLQSMLKNDWSIQSKLSYSYNTYKRIFNASSNDTSWQDTISASGAMTQHTTHINQAIQSEFRTSKHWGDFRVGPLVEIGWHKNHIVHSVSALDWKNFRGNNDLQYLSLIPQLSFGWHGSLIECTGRIGYSLLQSLYPNDPWKQATPTWKVGLNAPIGNGALRINAEQSLSPIIANNYKSGASWNQLESIALEYETLRLPKNDTKLSSSYSASLLNEKLDYTLAFVYGQVNTATAVSAITIGDLIVSQYSPDYLASRYFLGLIQIKTHFFQKKLSLEVEPAMIYAARDVTGNLETYTVKNQMPTISMKVLTNYPKSWINASLMSTYHHYNLSQNASGEIAQQKAQNWNYHLTLDIQPKQKWGFKTSFGQTHYQGLVHTQSLSQLAMEFVYKCSKHWAVKAYGNNLLNQTTQLRQTAEPLYYSAESISLLPRAIGGSIKYTFY